MSDTKETSLLYSNGRWVSLGEIEKLVEVAGGLARTLSKYHENEDHSWAADCEGCGSLEVYREVRAPFSPKNTDKTGAPEEKGVDRVKELEAQVAELERRLDHQYERGYNDGKKESGGIW
jgi:hypothetical protein